MPSEFCLGSRNLAVAESFSRGTSPVDWPGFSLDPETVNAVLRKGEVPGRSQHREEHNSLVGDVQRTIDVQTLKRPDKLSKGGFLAPEHSQTDVVHSGHTAPWHRRPEVSQRARQSGSAKDCSCSTC